MSRRKHKKKKKKKKKLKELVKVERKIIKIISYKLQFIESTRCMASYLSNLVNLAKGIHKPNLDVDTDIITKNVERVELNTKIVSAVLNTKTLKLI